MDIRHFKNINFQADPQHLDGIRPLCCLSPAHQIHSVCVFYFSLAGFFFSSFHFSVESKPFSLDPIVRIPRDSLDKETLVIPFICIRLLYCLLQTGLAPPFCYKQKIIGSVCVVFVVIIFLPSNAPSVFCVGLDMAQGWLVTSASEIISQCWQIGGGGKPSALLGDFI